MSFKLVNDEQLDSGLTAVAEAIRTKTGGTEPLAFPEGMAAAIGSIEQGGESGGEDLFRYITAPPVISPDIVEVTEDIVFHLERANSVSNMCSGVAWGCEKVTLYISDKCTTFFRSFRLGGNGCKLKEFEIIGDTSKVTNYSAAFDKKVNLERITGDLDFSSVTAASTIADMVGGCSKLQEIRIVSNTLSVSIGFANSPLLSAESVQSIVDGYKDMTGQPSPVLTLHADVTARMTDAQKAELTSKNVTIA